MIDLSHGSTWRSKSDNICGVETQSRLKPANLHVLNGELRAFSAVVDAHLLEHAGTRWRQGQATASC